MTAAQPNPESSGGQRNLYLVEMLLGGGLLLIVVAIFAGNYLPHSTKESENVLTLTKANWQKEVIDSKVPVVVDFWADWCGPCIRMAPTIDELAAHYAGRVKVGKLNIDDEKGIAKEYEISSIPAVYIFKGGREPQKVILGLTSKAHLTSEIDRVLQGPTISQ